METKTLTIEGMSCDMCVRAVTNALTDLAGVRSAQVSLAQKQAVVVYDPSQVNTEQMTEAISEEGYQASPQGV